LKKITQIDNPKYKQKWSELTAKEHLEVQEMYDDAAEEVKEGILTTTQEWFEADPDSFEFVR